MAGLIVREYLPRRGEQMMKDIPCQITVYTAMTARQAAMKPNMMPSSWPREDMGVYGGKLSAILV